jgi:hypothetical protein
MSLVHRVREGEVENQDQNKFWNGANKRRVHTKNVTQNRTAIQLAEGSANSDRQAERIGAERDQDRVPQALLPVSPPNRGATRRAVRSWKTLR